MTYRQIQMCLRLVVIATALMTSIGAYSQFSGAWPTHAWPLTVVSGMLTVWAWMVSSARQPSSVESEVKPSAPDLR